MRQFYEIKTYKQYDRDVKLAVRRGLDIEKLLTVVDSYAKAKLCLRSTTTICSVATTRATGSATSIPTGYCSTRRTPRYASSRSTAQAPTPTSSVKARNGST